MTKRSFVSKRVVLCVLTMSVIAFIFINSSFDADVSSAQSSSVMKFVNWVLSFFHVSVMLTEHFVRKCAHFAEYFVLGTLLFSTVRSFMSKLSIKIMLASFFGFLVAVIDELIQLSSIGRSAQFSDVMLDYFGLITAFLMCYLISKFIIKRNLKGKEVLN